jgi:glutathione peroxidase
MKKTLFYAATLVLLGACSESSEPTTPASIEIALNETKTETAMSFYDFKTETLGGEAFDFSTLKGKRVLIVNTASQCGYTPQYKQLQELYDTYGGEKFTIIGFPANNFGGQEPGSDAEIATFCEKNYGVTFPMMSKISVKGADENPIYKWLTQKDLNGVSDGNVKWNFHKFLIDENGNWVKELSSSVSPLDDVVTSFAQGK